MSEHAAVETDVLIVGSGAGALAAGVTATHHGARVLMVEKSEVFGGTSAMSGGGIWIPNSGNARRVGAEDSAEDAFRYMRTMIGDEVSEARIRAFIKAAPEMLAFLQKHSRLRYEAYPYPDYYPETSGARRGYRTQAPKSFWGGKLGQDLYRMRPQPAGSLVQGRYSLTFKEARKFLTQQRGWHLTLLKVLLAYHMDIPGRFRGKLARRLTQGHALVGSLYLSFRETGGALWLNAPMVTLTHQDGQVTGAWVERDGKKVQVRARRATILAAGGFEHNRTLREKFLPAPTQADWSVSQENNTGDALEAALELDAAVDLMEHAWWIPVIHVPGWPRPQGLFAERSLPGLVIVNAQGRRFANEALPYLESGYAMYEARSVPSWVVFDSRFRHKYPFGPMGPGWAMPDRAIPRKVRAIMVKAESAQALAEQAGIDPEGLAMTLERNNRFARSGVDEDFGRGQSFYDGYYGDAKNTPNPCIAPIEKPPFYALPIHPGDIGTKGGLLTNEHAQVMRTDGGAIPALYAAGNVAASVMGRRYLGAGATLGPAMAFAWVAARHALGVAETGAAEHDTTI